MPIYEYKCENGHVFDVMQRMSDEPLTTCTRCEANVHKVMQPVGISFRGSGFYSTDYSAANQSTPPGESQASKNGDSSNSSGSSNGSSNDSKTGSSTDSKTGSPSSGSGEKSASSSSSSSSSSKD